MGGWEKALGVASRRCGSEKGSTYRNKTWTRENTLSCAVFRSNTKTGNSNASFHNFTCNKTEPGISVALCWPSSDSKKTANVNCVELLVRQRPRQERCRAVCCEGGGDALRRRRLEASRGRKNTWTKQRLNDH